MDGDKKPEKPRAVSPRNGQPVPSNPYGRPKGTLNKSTEAVRNAIATFINNNSQHLDRWANEIYSKKGAEGSMQVFLDLLEYVQPKLARQEVQNLDKDGQPADAPKVTVEFVVIDEHKNT